MPQNGLVSAPNLPQAAAWLHAVEPLQSVAALRCAVLSGQQLLLLHVDSGAG